MQKTSDSAKDRVNQVATVPPGTPLSIEPRGTGEKLTAKLVGVLPQRYLIVHLPQSLGALDQLIPEKLVFVRYAHDGNLYGFQSKILWIQKILEKLLFLQYPPELEQIQLRQDQRIFCYLPVEIGMQQKDNYAQYKGIIQDTSTKGCKIIIPAADPDTLSGIEADNEVELRFHIIGLEKLILLSGVVRNVEREATCCYCGVQYTEVPDDMSIDIEKYVKRVSSYSS